MVHLKNISLNIIIILKGILSWPGTLYLDQSKSNSTLSTGGQILKFTSPFTLLPYDLTTNDTQLPKTHTAPIKREHHIYLN